MNLLSLSLAVWCSLLLGYVFIVRPVHGREELSNKLQESEEETKLKKAEIQSLRELMGLMESTGDDLADVMVKQRTRSRSPSRSPSVSGSRSKGIRKRSRSRSRSRSRKNRRTKKVFDSRTSRLDCRTRDPLSSFTEGVPRALENDVERFLQRRVGNVDCGGGISLIQLMQIANSMLPTNVFDVSGGQSYAYLPESRTCRGRFYQSGQHKCDNKYTCNRNFKDSEMYLLYDCPNVQEYWSGWTPCYFCEQSLMDWKEDTNHRGTVTVHVGRMYNWGNKRSTPECLALMIRQGFDLVPWNWSTFERQMGFSRTSYCQRVLDLIQICKEFDDAYSTIRRQIGQAEDLARRYRTEELDRMCKL